MIKSQYGKSAQQIIQNIQIHVHCNELCSRKKKTPLLFPSFLIIIFLVIIHLDIIILENMMCLNNHDQFKILNVGTIVQPQMCHDTDKRKYSSSCCNCQQNWAHFIWRCHHLSHLIGPDETVLAIHICPFMLLPPTSSRGRLWRSTAPCWTASGTQPPPGAGIRESKYEYFIFGLSRW